MQVIAFGPSLGAVQEPTGGVTTTGFPMTSCHVAGFPNQITIPVVLAVLTQAGDDYDMRRFVVATAPDGERVGALEFAWHWPDDPAQPVKFRVFAQPLPMRVTSAGTYTLGLYETVDGTDGDHLFPLAIVGLNPLGQVPSASA
jgi:hypothetical protein